MVFDLLYRSGRVRPSGRYEKRRARLEEIVAGAERIFPVRRLTSHGLVAWAEVPKACFEGYVAKDEASAYEAGRRGGGSRSSRRPGRSKRTAGGGASAQEWRRVAPVVKGDDEKIRNLLLGLTGLLI
jgi:hypothetical protein